MAGPGLGKQWRGQDLGPSFFGGGVCEWSGPRRAGAVVGGHGSRGRLVCGHGSGKNHTEESSLRLGDYLKGDYLGSGSILPVANATGAWAYYGSPWPRKKSFRGRAPLTQSKMIIYGQGVIYEWPLEGDGILRVANAGAIFKGQRGISRVVMTSLHGGGIRGGDGTIR